MANPSRTAPPPPPMRKGYVQAFEALYSYNAKTSDELSFEEGDILYIADQSDPNWWLASYDDRKGFIPSNYVSGGSTKVAIIDAAQRGNIRLLNECLEKGVSVNSLNKVGSSPLHAAAQGGHVDCLLRLLSEPKIQINLQNKLGDTPLHCASYRGHADVVELLLKHGAKDNIPNRENILPRALARTSSVISKYDDLVLPAEKRSSGYTENLYGIDSEDSD